MMAKLAETKNANLELSGIDPTKDSIKTEDKLLKYQKETIPIAADGEATMSGEGEFYPDKATMENMGTKKMIETKELQETKDFEGIQVTVEGVQIVEFEPNQTNGRKFDNYTTGMVLVTAKIKLKNEGKETLNLMGTSGKIAFGDKYRSLNQLQLEPGDSNEKLEPGQEGIKYIVFVIDKEGYDKLYKDQSRSLEVTLQNEEFSTITKYGDMVFEF